MRYGTEGKWRKHLKGTNNNDKKGSAIENCTPSFFVYFNDHSRNSLHEIRFFTKTLKSLESI